MKLGVNIDHIAVLREARAGDAPQLLAALPICQAAGADQITIHLREDRRHIQDQDVIDIIKFSKLPINLECALAEEIIDFICLHKPARATIVPENRQELTTEGGLNISAAKDRLQKTIAKLKDAGIEISLFIEPSLEATKLSADLGVEAVEFHTGKYANLYAMLYSNLRHTNYCIKEFDLPVSQLKKKLDLELEKIKKASDYAKDLGLFVAAGHGLDYQNVGKITAIKSIEELNIGQSIIARSVFDGLMVAIEKMKDLAKA